MLTIENHLGSIDISYEYLASLIGYTATSCFGVVDMNLSGAKQNFLSVIDKTKKIDKGVVIRVSKNKLDIDLHITVRFGTNIKAIVDSIMNKVRYTVEDSTGIQVSKVNVFVDGMIS